MAGGLPHLTQPPIQLPNILTTTTFGVYHLTCWPIHQFSAPPTINARMRSSARSTACARSSQRAHKYIATVLPRAARLTTPSHDARPQPQPVQTYGPRVARDLPQVRSAQAAHALALDVPSRGRSRVQDNELRLENDKAAALATTELDASKAWGLQIVGLTALLSNQGHIGGASAVAAATLSAFLNGMINGRTSEASALASAAAVQHQHAQALATALQQLMTAQRTMAQQDDTIKAMQRRLDGLRVVASGFEMASRNSSQRLRSAEAGARRCLSRLLYYQCVLLTSACILGGKGICPIECSRPGMLCQHGTCCMYALA